MAPLNAAFEALADPIRREILWLLSQAIALAEDLAFLSARGEVYSRLHRWPEAVRDFDRALALRPRGWWYTDRQRAQTLMAKSERLYRMEGTAGRW